MSSRDYPPISVKQVCEDMMWQDAYNIAWIGASNPKGVIRTISTYAGLFGYDHPAIEAMCDHLAFMLGHGLGPEFDILDQVRAEYARIVNAKVEHDRIEYGKLAMGKDRD
jgi:hypothetical protein